jgi:hypothetical protein
LEKHPGIAEGFATVPGVLKKSSKNKKMRHPGVPSGIGVFGRNTSDITGVNGHKIVF